MREINKIIIHCTDSDFGNAMVINEWHLERGFEKIGYHYVITNCYPTYKRLKDRSPDLSYDGKVEQGRSDIEIGAHCKGHNEDSIGICLVGVNTFTSYQIYALMKLLNGLCKEYRIPAKNIFGHYEFDPVKSCPNLDMETIRKMRKR